MLPLNYSAGHRMGSINCPDLRAGCPHSLQRPCHVPSLAAQTSTLVRTTCFDWAINSVHAFAVTFQGLFTTRESGCSVGVVGRMNSGVGVSPGNVPVYYGNGRLKAVEKKVKVGELVLRGVICGLGVLAVVLVGTDSQVREIFSIEKKAKFTDMKALVFLVIANGIAAGYSLIQGMRCVVSMVRGSVLYNKPLAWAIFSGDQIMAYLTLAAVAAAAQSAVLGEFGQSQLQWMKICNLYGKFCNQIGEGIVSALLVSLSMVTLSCMSAFNLFRLYGSKGKGGESW